MDLSQNGLFEGSALFNFPLNIFRKKFNAAGALNSMFFGSLHMFCLTKDEFL